MVKYDADSWIGSRFYSHFSFGIQKDRSKDKGKDIPANLLEKMGNAGLWPIENLPRKLKELSKDPIIVTIALTAIALFAINLGFYPEITGQLIKDVTIYMIKNVPFWAVKFAVYISLVESTIATAMRACGRFSNEALMDQFYGKTKLQTV